MEPAAARQALPGGAVPSYPADDRLEPRAAETRSRAPRRVSYPLQHPAGRRRPTSAADIVKSLTSGPTPSVNTGASTLVKGRIDLLRRH
jgi:hypothetical protein